MFESAKSYLEVAGLCLPLVPVSDVPDFRKVRLVCAVPADGSPARLITDPTEIERIYRAVTGHRWN